MAVEDKVENNRPDVDSSSDVDEASIHNSHLDNSPVDNANGPNTSMDFTPDDNATSFLISFMVDARGGAMRGCRHPGVRIIIPPRKCSMPTRITCRLVKKEKVSRPPPMLEGEGLAARVLEMGPIGTKFLGPVLIEVPHFASLRGKEREVVILRSDNGENWYEHPMQATEDAVTDALGSSAGGGVENSQASVSSTWKLDPEEDLSAKRIKRILTPDLPMYFALVSRVTRVKQESTVIGMEGGVLSSNVIPQVQAVLPKGTLTRPIPVGLQAQPIAPELVAKLLGNRVAVSPIVTIEPRRRKFHKPITLTIPVPKAVQKGMINQYGGERPTLRLLFSLAADPNPAIWEDVTDSKPMTLVDDCVSFTTTVSARFWLIDCQNIAEASQMASVLYQEAVTVPYMAKFVVFAKRDAPEEGKLRIFCMTDDKDDKTLEKQEKFFEVARSRDIEVLDGRPQYVEMAGNLIPVTKSGDQLHVNFRAFRENRLPCTVKIRDQDQDPSARVAFMKEPKVARGEAPQTPICNLNIKLPDMVTSDSGELDAEKAAELRQRQDFLRGQGIVIQDTVNRAEMKLSDIADNVQGDWVMLAQQLGLSSEDITQIKNDNKTVGDQASAMLHLWVQRSGDKATGNELETALRKINRDDVVRKCMYNVERVDDPVEAAAAKAAMDQSGFDTFKEEVGITKDSMKRGMSLDVQYDEQDMVKESESAGESPASDKGREPPAAPTARPTSLDDDDDDALLKAVVDSRRGVAISEVKTPEQVDEEHQRKQEAYLELAEQMDAMAAQEEANEGEGADQVQGDSVDEDAIFQSEKTSQAEAFPALRAGMVRSPLQQQPGGPAAYEDDIAAPPSPPPSPSDKYQSEEPVDPRDTDLAEASRRLAHKADDHDDDDHYGTEDQRPNEGRGEETEVMYSRAEVPELHVPVPVSTDAQEDSKPAEPSANEMASPMSDLSSCHDEPSPVPEPTLPDNFSMDELAYEKRDEFGHDVDDDEEYGKHGDDDVRHEDDDVKHEDDDVKHEDDDVRHEDDDVKHEDDDVKNEDDDTMKAGEPEEDRESPEVLKCPGVDQLQDAHLDVSSDADVFRTADQSLDEVERDGEDSKEDTPQDEQEYAPHDEHVPPQEEVLDRQSTPEQESVPPCVHEDITSSEVGQVEAAPPEEETSFTEGVPQTEPSDNEKSPDVCESRDADHHAPQEEEKEEEVTEPAFVQEEEAEVHAAPKAEDMGTDPEELETDKVPRDEDQPCEHEPEEEQNMEEEEKEVPEIEKRDSSDEEEHHLSEEVKEDDAAEEHPEVAKEREEEQGEPEEKESTEDVAMDDDDDGEEDARSMDDEEDQDKTTAPAPTPPDVPDLTAQVGDESFIERKEETMEAQPPATTRKATPDREFGSNIGFQSGHPEAPPHPEEATEPPSQDKEADDQDEASDGNVSRGENCYGKESLEDGTGVKHRCIMSQSQQGTAGHVEVEREEGPIKEETQVEDTEEVLPDGTVHHTHRVRRQSLKTVRICLKSESGEETTVEEKEEVPGTLKEDVVETFEEPARVVQEEHVEEEQEADGRTVQKHVVTQRMMHHIRTHQKSFDEGRGHQEEEYEIDKVVPGTETTFVTRMDEASTSSEEEEDDDDDESLSSYHSESAAGGDASGAGSDKTGARAEDEQQQQKEKEEATGNGVKKPAA